MANLFPSNVGMSHVRGIVKIIKENNGKLSITRLAEESEEDVDDLLPLLEASKLLGFIVITRSDVKLTPKGEKLVLGTARAVIRESLSKIEPFRSTIKALSGGSKSTEELFEYLSKHGVFPIEGEHSSETLLKLLLTWGVRSKLLSYDEEKETWILVS
jgi:NitT/TauT family transport system ATP-binding protein